jgi:hypothetical protein
MWRVGKKTGEILTIIIVSRGLEAVPELRLLKLLTAESSYVIDTSSKRAFFHDGSFFYY